MCPPFNTGLPKNAKMLNLSFAMLAIMNHDSGSKKDCTEVLLKT